MEQQKPRVGILIFDDVEVLDFCGPFEVFATANLGPGTGTLFEVWTIAEELRTTRATGGLLVMPHYSIDEHPPLDIVLLPGGDTRQVSNNPRVLDWIAAQNGKVEVLSSVCTGAFMLAKSGLLDGLAATTHWGSISRLRELYPSVTVRERVRFVDQGRIVTSAGVSAGIDMALHIVARYFGPEAARHTARRMEYQSSDEEIAGYILQAS